jgi:hypothetical protein
MDAVEETAKVPVGCMDELHAPPKFPWDLTTIPTRKDGRGVRRAAQAHGRNVREANGHRVGQC